MYIIVYLAIGLLAYGFAFVALHLLVDFFPEISYQEFLAGYDREMQTDYSSSLSTIEEIQETNQKMWGNTPLWLLFVVFWPLCSTIMIICVIGCFKNKKD